VCVYVAREEGGEGRSLEAYLLLFLEEVGCGQVLCVTAPCVCVSLSLSLCLSFCPCALVTVLSYFVVLCCLCRLDGNLF
jgi:hypothetical protein